MHRYTVAEEKSGLVLTEKAGNMQLFLQYVDDLHQWDFIHTQKMVNENERLCALLRTVHQQRESWKVRALRAEAELFETTAKTNDGGGCQNVTELRYAALKRYLAKQFHPDCAPGRGFEKTNLERNRPPRSRTRDNPIVFSSLINGLRCESFRDQQASSADLLSTRP